MSIRILTSAAVVVLVTGCASVPLESKEASDAAKQFPPPAAGTATIYVYRSGSFGGALKKDVWINGECVGESAPNVFFVKEVKGDEEHKISTESEFSPNDLLLKATAGMQYFVRQFIKMGVFVGGAGLALVSEAEGKKAVSELKLAKGGNCSKK